MTGLGDEPTGLTEARRPVPASTGLPSDSPSPPGDSTSPDSPGAGPSGRSAIQVSLTGMIGLVACVAVNIWLFRFGLLYGLIGLNLTKHVAVAALCQGLGVNRRIGPGDRPDTEGVNAAP